MISWVFSSQNSQFYHIWRHMTSLLKSFFVIFLKISIKLLIIDLQTSTIPPFVMFFNESIWYLGLFHVKIVNFSFLTSHDVIIDVIFVIFLKICIQSVIFELKRPPYTILRVFIPQNMWYLGWVYVEIVYLSILTSQDVIIIVIIWHFS